VKLKAPFTFAGYSFTGRGSLFDADNEMVIIGIDSEQGQEIARRVNAHDALVEACEFWLGAVQNSLGLRLALTELPEGAGPILVDMLQDALALVRGEADDA